MLVVVGLGSENGEVEIVIVESRLNDFVPSVFQLGEFDVAADAMPAVEEKNLHQITARYNTGSSRHAIRICAS
jgi:hypothetical protein